MSSLNGKVVIVTGASRGIGRAIALRLARDGAAVACVATSVAGAQKTVDAIVAEGGTAAAFAANVAEAESVEKMVADATAQLGPVYGLVNNAGITKDTLLIRMKDEDWDEVLAVNLKGAFLATRAVAKPMMKAREGRIVNVSSIVGLSGAAGQANYAASKAGMIGMTKSLAKELGARGITVNAVAPGFIETDMTEHLPTEMREKVLATAPLGRLGSPEDIAGAVAFLLGPEAAYVTGQTLTVDGGLTL